jgi:hypothetical protein
MYSESPEQRRRRLSARREAARRAGERCEAKFVQWLSRQLGVEYHVGRVTADEVFRTGHFYRSDVGNVDAAVWVRGRKDPFLTFEVKSKPPRPDSAQVLSLYYLSWQVWGAEAQVVVPVFEPGTLLMRDLWRVAFTSESLEAGKPTLGTPFKVPEDVFLEGIAYLARQAT